MLESFSNKNSERHQWCPCSMLMGSTATPDLYCISWKVWRSRCKRWKMRTSGRATTMVPWNRQVGSSSRFCFFLGVCFFGSLPFASFVFFNDNSTTPRFFAGFWSSNGSFKRFLVGFQALSSSMLYVWVLMDLFAPTWANFFATRVLPNCDVKDFPP